MAEHPPALAAHQFGHVGVLLLGHQAAAGGAAIREDHKAELLTRPENHLLTEAAEVGQHQAGGRHELHGEIPITHRIETVGVDGIKTELRSRGAAIDRHRRAGQGGRSQGTDVDPPSHVGQALAVTLSHLDVGQQVVGQAEGLGPLQVRVAGDQGVGVALGLVEQGPLQAQQIAVDGIDLAPQPEAQVGAHLVVAGAARVQFLAQGTEQLNQPPLHGEVHILGLQTGIEPALGRLAAHLFQPFDQAGGLLQADHPGAAEHAGMGHRAVQVLLEQGDIEADRGVEALDRRVQALLETLAPGGGGGIDGHGRR